MPKYNVILQKSEVISIPVRAQNEDDAVGRALSYYNNESELYPVDTTDIQVLKVSKEEIDANGM